MCRPSTNAARHEYTNGVCPWEAIPPMRTRGQRTSGDRDAQAATHYKWDRELFVHSRPLFVDGPATPTRRPRMLPQQEPAANGVCHIRGHYSHEGTHFIRAFVSPIRGWPAALAPIPFKKTKAASLHRLAAHDCWSCTPRRTAATGLPNQPAQARLPRGTHGRLLMAATFRS